MNVPLPDGGHISVAVQGSGPPLLLLRPLGGSVESWGSFATTLARDARIIAFDPRGAGCSSAAPIGTTTRSMAADAIAVLDAMAVERPHVFGLSLGGMVASWLAIDAPARIDRLVLASTPLRGLAVHAGSIERALALVRCMAQPASAAEACLATRILSPRFVAEHPEQVVQIQTRAQARPASHCGMLSLLWAAAMHDLRSRIGLIHADTLVLGGVRDVFVTVVAQQQLAEELQYGRFALVPDAGHDLSVEAPLTTADLVLGHIHLRGGTR